MSKSSRRGRAGRERAASVSILNKAVVEVLEERRMLSTVTIATTTYDAYEAGAVPGTITVTRDGDTSNDLTVYVQETNDPYGTGWYWTGGDAGYLDYHLSVNRVSDWEAPMAVVTIPSGESSAAFNVIPNADSIFENDESANFTLVEDPYDSSYYSVGSPAAASVVVHDMTIAQFSGFSNVSLQEGSGSVNVPFLRWTSDTSSDLTVWYQVQFVDPPQEGSASANDLTIGNATLQSDGSLLGSVTIASGDSFGSASLAAVADGVEEGGEWVTLQIIPDPNSAYSYTTCTNSQTQVMLTDRPAISVTGADTVVAGRPYTLDLSASNPTRETTWSIDWGDESDPDEDSVVGESITGNPTSVDHTYADAGNHTITSSATDSGGGPYAATPIALTVTPTPPEGPDNLIADSGDGVVDLSWDAVEGAASYNVYRATSAGGEGITPFAMGLTSTSYTDSRVVPGTTYYYKVTVLNSIGMESLPSAEASGFVPVGLSCLISGPAAVDEGSAYSLSLSTNEPSSDGVWLVNWGDGLSDSVTGDQTSVTHTYSDGPNSYAISAQFTLGSEVAQAGMIVRDPTFGSNGQVISTLGAGDSIVQPDGKILVLASTANASVLVRYNADGTVDQEFGNNGVATLSTSGYETGIALVPDGRILVGSWSNLGPSVARYSSTGIPDSSFGIAGTATLPVSAPLGIHIAVGTDGKIVLGGSVLIPDPTFGYVQHSYFAGRFNSDGSVDASFNGVGWTVTDITIGDDDAGAVVVQSDGKIIVGGSAQGDFALVRYNLDGSLDQSYGTEGVASGRVGMLYGSAVTSLIVQPDGKVLVGGSTTLLTPSGDPVVYALIRFNTNGTIDDTFGSPDGYASSYQVLTSFDGDAWINRLVLWGNRILAVGTKESAAINNSNMAIVCYRSDGSLDYGFGSNGTLIEDVSGSMDTAENVAVQSNGKLVVIGTSYTGTSEKLALLGYSDQSENSIAVLVNNVAPTAAISGAPATSLPGTAINLGSTASDPGNDTLSYLWSVTKDGDDFTLPEGTIVDASTFSFTPADAGSYAVSLLVSDGDGGSATDTRTIAVSQTASVSADPTSINEGSPMTLTLTSSDPDNTTGWTINWGDPSDPDNVQTIDGNPASVEHIYRDGADAYSPFSISATATIGGQTVDAQGVDVFVQNVAPTLSISGGAATTIGSQYVLNLFCSDPGDDTLSGWEINWGDGGSVETVAGDATFATHTYTAAGTTTITATAADEDGGPYVANNQGVTITLAPPDTSAASVNLEAVAGDGVVDLSWAGVSGATSYRLYRSTVSGEEGTTPYASGITGTSFEDSNVSDGTAYYYVLSAVNSGGESGQSEEVSALPSQPSFFIDGDGSVNEGEEYTLNLIAANQDPSGWQIDWGDGESSSPDGSATSATHTYADGPNDFTISATASVGDGNFSAGSLDVSVNNVAPTADFAASDSAPDEGSSVTFTFSNQDDASDADKQADFTYSYDFDGDGTFEVQDVTDASQDHTFTDNGRYTVVGRITDQDGDYTDYPIEIDVANVAPTFTITPSATQINEGQSVTLAFAPPEGGPVDPGADTIGKWTIDWGDGTVADGETSDVTALPDIQTIETAGLPGPVTHTYSDNRKDNAPFQILISAKDEDGTYPQAPIDIAVSNVAPDLAGVTGSVLQTYANDLGGPNYMVSLSATDPGLDTISSWSVDWGDGSTPDAAIPGNTPYVTHRYQDTSSSTPIVITCTDEDGTYLQSLPAVAAAPPTGFTAALNATNPTSQINLAWNGQSNINGFIVELSTDGAPWKEIARPVSTATSYVATGLSAATSYSFRLRAFNGLTNSSPVPQNLEIGADTITTAPITGTPDAPSGLTATIVDGNVKLEWQDNPDAQVSFYVEAYSPDAPPSSYLPSQPLSPWGRVYDYGIQRDGNSAWLYVTNSETAWYRWSQVDLPHKWWARRKESIMLFKRSESWRDGSTRGSSRFRR